jgi:hypothetical protein
VDYQVGYDSVKHLTECIITKCGLTRASSHIYNACFCFQDVFRVHQKVYHSWFDPSCNTSGPNVTYIIEKALYLFPHLTSSTIEATIKFYNNLQSTGVNYLLLLMHFDSIYIPFGFEGLCPPRLGTHHYAEASSAFMVILPHLLPVSSIPCVLAIMDSVAMESHNEYNLLFCVMVLAIPKFDPTLPLMALVWTPTMELFEFCRSHHFYF